MAVLETGQTGLGSCNRKKKKKKGSLGSYPTLPNTPVHINTHTQNAHSSTLHTCDRWFLILGTFEVFFYQLRGDTDHMLAFPVLDHVEGLQGADDVVLGDAGHLAVEKEHSSWRQQKG